jgi:hypothetical protein
MAVIRLMTRRENLKKAMRLHVQQCSSILSDNKKPGNLFNESLKLLIDASDEDFIDEKLTTASYSENEESLAIKAQAERVYESKTGLKPTSRKLYDMALRLYIKKYSK